MITTGDFVVARGKPALLIVEIGNNHDGSVELAGRLVEEAVALLSRFQRAIDDMFAVIDYRKRRGILPPCTPWNEESPDAPEPEALARTGKPLICSTGMSMRRRRPREPVGSDGLLAYRFVIATWTALERLERWR